MTPERWGRIDELFRGEVQLDPEARESWLGRACGGDEDLRAEVGRLLAGDERANRDGFLRPPDGPARAPEPRTTDRTDAACPAEGDRILAAANAGRDRFPEVPDGTVTPPQLVSVGPGVTIGPYKLLQKLGEGGFGVVYMAEQETPVQSVAEGYQDTSMLKGDPDLASLRSREDFQKLVGEMERKSTK